MRAIVLVSLLLGCGSSTAPESKPSAEPATSLQPLPDAMQAAEAKGTLKEASFHSKALGVDKDYQVYLPAGYQLSEKRYPVVYMLHGIGGEEGDWPRTGIAKTADEMALQAILVMLDGDDSFYVDTQTKADYEACLKTPRPFGKAEDRTTYCVRDGRYESYVVTDAVAHIDASYRTIASREGRAIGGLSMGGYGALVLGMRHKDVFSSIASHSGIAALLYKGPYPYQQGKVQQFDNPAELTQRIGAFGVHMRSIFGEAIGNWRAHDPATLAQSLGDGDLAIYLDCGTEDGFRLQHGASYLHEVLEARGITHDFALVPGKHDWALWADRIDESLTFHVRHFEALSKAVGNAATQP